MQPYPKYKDSGIPWLGKVPEHWEALGETDCAKQLEQMAKRLSDGKEEEAEE